MSMTHADAIRVGGLESGLAKALVVMAVLNLNGLSFMLLGITQIFSLGMLVCSVALLLMHNRVRVNTGLLLFLGVIVGHLVFGLLFVPVYNDPQADVGLVLTLVGTLLLTGALVVHIQQLRTPEALDDFLRFVRNMTIVSAVATLASPWLYTIYANPPPSADTRNAGFFANPNEAGLMCAMALIMTLMQPFRNRILHLVVIMLIIFSSLAPFSRAAILLVMLIALMSVLQARMLVRVALTPLLVAIIALIQLDPQVILDLINSQTLFDLDRQQTLRLETTVLAASGEITADTSNSRTEMMAISVQKALQVLPWGTGLGSHHHIQDGIRGAENWLGSHNAYLMVWGEAGFLIFVLMLVFTAVLFFQGLRSARPWGSFYLLLLFVFSSVASHDTFEARFMNVAIALLLGLSSVRRSAVWRHPAMTIQPLRA